MPFTHTLHLDCENLLRSFDGQQAPRIMEVNLSPGSGTLLMLQLESESPLPTSFQEREVKIRHNLAGPSSAFWV